jgi:hypothetical protein
MERFARERLADPIQIIIDGAFSRSAPLEEAQQLSPLRLREYGVGLAPFEAGQIFLHDGGVSVPTSSASWSPVGRR